MLRYIIFNFRESIYTDYVGNFVVHFYKFQNLFFCYLWLVVFLLSIKVK